MLSRLLIVACALWVLGGCTASPPVRPTDDTPPAPLLTSPLPIFYDAVPDDDVFANLLYELLVGEIAGHLGQLDISVEHYLRAAQLSHESQVAERATRIALIAGAADLAIEAVQRWLVLAPENLDARQVLAALLVNEGRPEEALGHLEYLMQRVQQVEDNGFGLVASLLSRSQNAPAATAAMRLLAQRYPHDIRAYLALANLAAHHQDYAGALLAAEQALRINPQSMPARMIKARALSETGQAAAALESLQRLLQDYPDNHELRMTYARMLLRERRFEQAQQVFSALIQSRPHDSDLIYTLALLHIEAEQYQNAERHLRRLLELRTREQEARYYLGRIADITGRAAQALQWYERVSDGDYWLEAHSRAATLHAEAGRLHTARERFERLRFESVHTDEIVRLYLLETQILRDQRAYAEGMALLNEALDFYPEEPSLLYARALMAERLDRLDILEADLRTILAQDPDNAAALNALGYTLADRTDRYQEAYGYIIRAYELVPDDAAITDSLGWVLFRLGRLDEAEIYLRRAHAMLEDAEIASNLAALLWARGHYDEAWEILRTALEMDPKHERLLRLQQQFIYEQ